MNVLTADLAAARLPAPRPGELVALVHVETPDGGVRLAAIANVNGRPLVGVLRAADNGAASNLGFEPHPELHDALAPIMLGDQPRPANRRPAVDPDDPRGLKRGGVDRSPPPV